MSTIKNPTCPGGCGTFAPAMAQDKCAPQIFFGEITHIYYAAGNANPLNDVEDVDEWTARLEQGGNDINSIRTLHVVGDMPAATAEEIIISLGRKIFSPAERVINITIDDLTDEVYEFARATACNTAFKIWAATPNHIYGGNVGIMATFNLSPIIEQGQKSLNKIQGTINWESQFPPERNVNPFAGQ